MNQGRIHSPTISKWLACGALILGVIWAKNFRAEHPIFTPARYGAAELRIVNSIPVAVFRGTPEEIGQQHAKLLTTPESELMNFPRKLFDQFGLGFIWPLAVQASKTLMMQAPERYQSELAATAAHGQLDAGTVSVANTLLELRRMGCSTLVVEPERSETGGLLFGRNFDFPPLGLLDKYSVVMVFHPTGKKAFAAVGFPSFIGVLSGMNEDGLSVATLDVYSSGDSSPRFEPTGVPLAMVFRQILEECSTIEEAAELLQNTQATTHANLAVCDRNRGVIFEITPHQVVQREADEGLLSCTNHFRSEGLSLDETCWRYDRLAEANGDSQIGVEALGEYLHRVNQGELTLQTMIFEPNELVLHLALGTPPSSANQLQRIELAEFFARGE